MGYTINNGLLLNHLTQAIESQLAEVNNLYKNQPAEILLRPAADGGWSIAQCLEHLNTYSAWYNAKIQAALTDRKNVPGSTTFKSGWLGAYLTNMIKQDATKKKYKAMAQHRPTEQLDARQVIESFLTNQQTLLQLIKKAAGADLECIRITTTISAMIRLKLGDVLQFLVAHQDRHLSQARRNYQSQYRFE
jgi:hypothetical protein